MADSNDIQVPWDAVNPQWNPEDRPEGWSEQDEWADRRAQAWNASRSLAQAREDASQSGRQ